MKQVITKPMQVANEYDAVAVPPIVSCCPEAFETVHTCVCHVKGKQEIERKSIVPHQGHPSSLCICCCKSSSAITCVRLHLRLNLCDTILRLHQSEASSISTSSTSHAPFTPPSPSPCAPSHPHISSHSNTNLHIHSHHDRQCRLPNHFDVDKRPIHLRLHLSSCRLEFHKYLSLRAQRHCPPLEHLPRNLRSKLGEQVPMGSLTRSRRREPGRRLRERHRRHRRLGRRTQELQLRRRRLQREHGTFHAAGVERHHDGRLRESGLCG